MIENRFFICEHCGNIVGMVNNNGVPVVCCGEKMKELIPNSSGASEEKHIPVVKINGNQVDVEIGAAAHPMLDEHNIAWVYLLTEKGGQRKRLSPGQEAKVSFAVVDDKPVAVYAYCNLHGLWKTEL